MKVYIGTCGIGLGHAGRMVEVAKELERRGVEIVFSTYDLAVEFIRRKGFRVLEFVAGMWYEHADGSIDFLKSTANSGFLALKIFKRISQDKRYIRKESPDLVISDTMYSTVFAMKQIDLPFFFVTNQARIIFPRMSIKLLKTLGENIVTQLNFEAISNADEIIIPDFPKPYTIARDNQEVPEKFENKLRFVGPIVPETKEVSKEIMSKDYDFREEFIFAPISGPGISRVQLIEKLKKILPEIDERALITTGNIIRGKNEVIENVTVKHWVNERFGLMKECKIIITRAGLSTIGEIIKAGKPSILIPQPNQPEQESNARSMEMLGLSKVIMQKDLSHETLKNAIHEILNDAEFPERMSKMQKLLERYDGARNIAELVVGRIGSKHQL